MTPSRPHWTGLKGFGSKGSLRDRPDVVDRPLGTALPKERGPLTGVEVTRAGTAIEAKLGLASLQELSRHDGTWPLSKPARKKRLIAVALGHGDKRFVAADDAQQCGVHRRRRRKDASR
jgi:hypothetical protein